MTECRDHPMAMRQVREHALAHYDLAPFLSAKDRADFLAGKCKLRQYENTPILDYTQPWGQAESLCRHGYEWPNCPHGCHCISASRPGGIMWVDRNRALKWW